jgi:amino acid adenylation domain-containing protein
MGGGARGPGSGLDTIGTRLAQVAGRLPANVAIVEQKTRVSFRELEAESDAIARRIAAAGQRRPGVVGLLFQSKLRAIEAIFGACKSGRPYVPLDAGDPDERLRFVVRDSEPIALLTEGALEARARNIASGACAVIDIARLESGDDDAPLPLVRPDAPAYVYYTSGSTGRPKGVVQNHRNVLFFADAYAKALRIDAGDRFSLLNTLSFAAANMNVFRALLHGASVCAYDLRREGIPQLADWLDRERVTLLHAVPSVFREMARRLASERLLPHLRVIHLGGESVYAGDVELFRRHTLRNCVLVNQLASTEAVVIAQNILTHKTPAGTDAVVPVGLTVEGTRVEIRRDDGTLAGTDEVGEMVVCGAHLSPGYWRRPDLDAAAFSEDAGAAGWRRYKSGDLGRIDPSGKLHFLGRKGSRVKIRGHSIDLMEIEAALATCPDVAQAAVVATGDEAKMERVRLVAFVAPRDGAVRDPRLIRRFLSTRLPLYMLPTDVRYLDALPMTASGKIDRTKLVVPEGATAVEPESRGESPQDRVERAVAAIFERLLKLESVGRDDDFFLLGGDSLLAVELQMRLVQTFGTRVGNFHQGATVARIAADVRAAAESARRPGPLPVLVPLWQSGGETPLFIVHGRHGQAFVGAHFMQLLGDDQPVWAFQARGLDGLSEPHATVEDMAADYLRELRAQRPRGPYFLGGLCAGAYVAVAMARALRGAGETVLPLLLLDPPNNGRMRAYEEVSKEQFARRMRMRRARGVTAGPVEDPRYMNALLRTALAFEHAIGSHRPLPYDGPVYVLSSRHRMDAPDALDLRRIFTGRFKRYEVGSNHIDALDPRNPVFAKALMRCVGLIREAAREHVSRVA